MTRACLIAALLASSAWAGPVYERTIVTPVSGLSTTVFYHTRGQLTRYEGTSLDAVLAPRPLDAVVVRWEITDPRGGGLLMTSLTGTVVDASAGRWRVTAPASLALDDGAYHAQVSIYHATTTAYVDRLAWDTLVVGYACSTCSVSYGGSGSGCVSVGVYNVVSAGPTSINGITSGPVTIVADDWMLGIATNGNTLTITNKVPPPPTNIGYVVTLQYYATNGQYLWQPIGGFDPITSGVGTNLAPYAYIGNAWQTWTCPANITQAEFYVWGGGGAGSGGHGNPAGFVFMSASTIPGTIYELAVAEGGKSLATPARTNSWIGAGKWWLDSGWTNKHAAGVTHHSGGGLSAVRIQGTTNYLCVAAGGSAAGIGLGNTEAGGKDGELGVNLFPTNFTVGTPALADNWYGFNALPGTNGFDSRADGSFMQGGATLLADSMETNRSYSMFTAGGSWQGAGGVIVNSTNGVASSVITYVPSTGGSYVNPAYGFGYTERGGPARAFVGGMEIPWYVSPAGQGGNNAAGSAGLIVVRY